MIKSEGEELIRNWLKVGKTYAKNQKYDDALNSFNEIWK